ncbi:protein transport protein Sec16B [Sinocyclocheilus grahami]|uniref:protein transport protein Sec16B n=1 Tax=Sinocyclocheilus grahami TaxID=75366 RepID=UPI0007AC60BA|nr:PREDICTED: protein transport protein Sec16B [Sinocyclocheilus grahami]XP_016093637.1 PREDICTED: protein transport protein Sec16B [Sinocyclocheilus grahami]XP_016093638.1 PREDICTED: protein transport protein Sec16B [Sinocyclocheilus grahami]XP_016093639.1 PREDICTED: protein transport protein Sec16B [Sinocyclocheilus grahami]
MEPRGQGWHTPGYQYQSSNRDDHYRSSHQTPYYYPPTDPRGRERQRPHVDPHYGSYMASPPPKPEYIPGYSSAYASNQPLHFRPHSRQEYDYPASSYWPYRDDYGYYDYHGYHRSQYSSPDGGGWRTEGYQGRGLQQESARASYFDQQGYSHRTDSHYDHGVSERQHRESMENGDGTGEVYDSGALANSKASGLSSSSYELSQYISGTELSEPELISHTDAVPMEVAPLKFCIPHVAVSFGPSGQLVWVSPALASEGEPAQVELHSLEVILCDTHEQQDMRDFPGPLAREDLHKVDAINFALQMSEKCLKDEKLEDATSAALLWHLLILLCRQNGRIMGSDVAELLMRDSSSLGACGVSGDEDGETLIDLSETPTSEKETFNFADLLTGYPPTDKEAAEQNLQRYTKLLLSGRKKEALESAMQSGLWGHALFLASKMDSRSYNTVLSRFTGSLAPSDPLQTLFQLLSGRIPAVSMSWSSEKWGDWRPHLAVLLSNETGDPFIHHRSIITMGDTLASRDMLYASQICYLTAQCSFGWYTNRSERLVLLGSKQSVLFSKFCHNSAIRCTELFEYCQRLGNAEFIVPAFQVYKFLYACRLLDCGLVSQAFHYCEVVAKALLKIEEPHVVLQGELIELVDRLKFSEAQLSDTGQPFLDPDWLVQIRCRRQAMLEGSYCNEAYQSPVGETTWSHEESNTCSDFTEGFQTDGVNHTSTENETSNPPQSMIPNTDAGFQESYSTVSHSYSSEEQAPKTVAPVPLYPTQQPMTLHPVFPMEMSGPPQVSLDQSHSNLDSSSKNDNFYTAASTFPTRSYNDTDGDFSAGAIMGAAENDAMVGSVNQSGTIPYQDNQRESSTQSAKPSKPGWFSGWFKSKPKEDPKEQIPEPKPTTRESTANFPFPSPPPLIPKASQPQLSGINPFSRSAGQKLSGTMSPNQGSISQGP